MQRRRFLQTMLGMAAAAAMLPVKVLAAVWNRAAFDAKTAEGALQGLGANAPQPSADILIKAPDRAENGAVVQVEIASRIPNTEAIAIVVAHNPTALIANFMFSNGAEPYVVTRIKMAEDSEIQAIVKAGDRYYKAGKQVEVLLNGCE